jgi:hypothetical protein
MWGEVAGEVAGEDLLGFAVVGAAGGGRAAALLDHPVEGVEAGGSQAAADGLPK